MRKLWVYPTALNMPLGHTGWHQPGSHLVKLDQRTVRTGCVDTILLMDTKAFSAAEFH